MATKGLKTWGLRPWTPFAALCMCRAAPMTSSSGSQLARGTLAMGHIQAEPMAPLPCSILSHTQQLSIKRRSSAAAQTLKGYIFRAKGGHLAP